MRVLIGCEHSGIVRDAFIERGHECWSCDLEPSDTEGPHLEGDIFEAIRWMCFPERWDLIILHPPCTHLAVCGNGSWADTAERTEAIEWTMDLWDAAGKNIYTKIAMENPVGVLSSQWRKPDQYIQPWQYGHGETKKTGLWLHGLPQLIPTDIVSGREGKVWKMSPGPERSRLRGITYQGIANAMADQWG